MHPALGGPVVQGRGMLPVFIGRYLLSCYKKGQQTGSCFIQSKVPCPHNSYDLDREQQIRKFTLKVF